MDPKPQPHATARNLVGGPMCQFCVHYEQAGDLERCAAYPKGIPDRILYEDEVMRVPAAHWQANGDEQAQVVFEKRDDVEWEEVEAWDDKRIKIRGIVGPSRQILDEGEQPVEEEVDEGLIV